ncbi:hypothetical protein [uncultured Jatrophihabitans sp.]|uniref:hypothetical protein n=1 Tax=uncultured Jatrophihabitans sp. TaxID=1610747 RepID=UPI0035C9B568
MTSSKQYLNDMTVTSDHDLALLWSTLVGEGDFDIRSLRLVIIDEAGRPAPVVVPIDDVPLVPSPAEVDSFGHFFDHLAGFGSPALLLSRPGSSEVQEHDRYWASAMAPFVTRWPMQLATQDAFGRVVISTVSDSGRAQAS